ncbi:MAG TPA: esterase-like activity of phytase family protein, partial [Verrucomicrobiota bacterium]|nr:esterase-like activity of phytase family protein [Verrucomicrobiota bacterium]
VREKSGPSLLLVKTNGVVLARYPPQDKPLKGAPYPVKPILPAVLSKRRDNRGFESVALSADGKTAYVMLQSAAIGKPKKKFNDSRVSRVVRLDVSEPLNARVTGHFLMPLHAASEFTVAQKQTNVKLNDAEWIGQDKLLVLEQAKGEARLLVADFSQATNLLDRTDENELSFEAAGGDLSQLKVTPARVETWFSTKQVNTIDSDKLEGLAIVGPQEIALVNDNDFGTGDNKTGQPSTFWLIRVNRPMP